MKRVIALMLSIAMIASLATGLAVTGFAADVNIFYTDANGANPTSNTDGNVLKFTVSGTDVSVAMINKDKIEGTIKIPDTVSYGGTTYNVTSIEKEAFGSCTGLTSVTIGNGVTRIGSSAFSMCTNLESVTIGKSVSSLDSNIFANCSKLKSIIVDAENVFYSSIDGVLYSNDKEELKLYPASKGAEFRIPDGVTSISKNAFSNCTGLTSIKIPSSVTCIGQMAFNKCSGLTSVIIGSGIESIGQGAFWNCTSLTSVTISAEDPPTATDAFYGCISLTDIIVPVNFIAKYKANSTWDAYKSFLKADTTTGIEINDEPIENCFDAYGASQLTVSGDTVTVDKITTNTDITINIPKDKILKVSTTNTSANEDGIASGGEINIKGKGRLVINAAKDGINTANHEGNGINIAETTINITTNSVGINANNKINITSNSDITVDSGGCGLAAIISVNIASGCVVKARTDDQFGAFYAGSISIDGQPITQANIKNGTLSNTNVYIIIADSGKYATVPYVEPRPDPRDPLTAEEEEQADPEIDIDLGFGTVRIKSSEKSLVMDEKRLIDKIAEELDGDKISFDLTKAYIADTKSTKDFDGVYFNNDIYKELGVIDKDIEINTRYAKAIVYTGKEVGNNPLSLHLSDVSKEQGKCATAIQKKAMQTSNIYAEVNYSFVTNGKPTDNSAKIYVPVSGPAKVFYLFNAEKIGIVPCEVKDGYCIFDRYFDGTYIVCAN